MTKLRHESLWTVEIRYGKGEGRTFNFVGQPGFYTVMDALACGENELDSSEPGDFVSGLLKVIATIRGILTRHNAPLDYAPGWHPFFEGRMVIGHYRTSSSAVFIRQPPGNNEI